MVEEIYKDIKDLEGKYQVSNFGNVLSLNYHRTGKPKLLKPKVNKHGYLHVGLWKNRKRKWFDVHRLVAEAFIPNPDNLPQINHKDENKTNNSVYNLEWVTAKENSNHGTRNKRMAKTKSKKVLQFTLDGEFIREWPSTQECGRNGFSQSYVAACCRGEYKQAYNYKWQYA